MDTTENNVSEDMGTVLSSVTPGEKTKVTIDNKSYYVQIPECGINSETTFLVAGRGSGSILDTNETFDQSVGKNTVVIAPENASTEVFSKAIDIADYYKKANNNTTETTVQGHSATCGTVLQAEINHNAQTNTKSTLVFCDSHTANPMNIKNMETISGTTVINFTDDKSPSTQEYVTKMAQNGANILSIEYKTGLGVYSHGFSDELAANSNIQSIGTDGAYSLDNLPSTVSYHPAELGTTQNVNVQYSFSCTDSSGNKVKLTKSQAQEYLNISNEIEKAYNEKNTSGSYSAAIGASKKLADAQKRLDDLVNSAKNNTEDMYANDNTKVNDEKDTDTNITDEETTESDESTTPVDGDGEGETQSDTSTIDEFVSELYAKIASSVIRNKNLTNESYESTTAVPPIEPPIISKVFNSSEELLNKVALEAKYIEQVGEDFETLDINLAYIADSLNYELTSVKANMVTVDPQYLDTKDSDYAISSDTMEQYETLLPEIEKEMATPTEEELADETEDKTDEVVDDTTNDEKDIRTEIPVEDIPTETPIQTQPTETPAQTQPTETPAQTQPTETPAQTQPTETPAQTQPTETNVQTQPTETLVQTQPTETPAQTQQTETPAQTQQTETNVQTQPTETPVQTQSTVDEHKFVANFENVDKIDFDSIVSDDHRLVYDIGKGTKMQFNHENGIVTGMSHTYSFDDEASLNDFLNNLDQYYSETNLISKIVTDNKNVIVEFKEDAYKGYTTDIVRNLYSSIPYEEN